MRSHPYIRSIIHLTTAYHLPGVSISHIYSLSLPPFLSKSRAFPISTLQTFQISVLYALCVSVALSVSVSGELCAGEGKESKKHEDEENINKLHSCLSRTHSNLFSLNTHTLSLSLSLSLSGPSSVWW